MLKQNMQRQALLIAVAMAASAGAAAGGMPCDPIEYAQLKDSSKAELVDAYCSAQVKAQLNKELREISMKLADDQIAMGARSTEAMGEARARGDAQVSCLKVADSVSAMLKKKFGAKPPTCK